MGDREPGELSASPVRRRPSSDSKKRSRSPSSESSGERRKRSKKSEKGSKDKKRDRSKERSQKEKPRDKSSSKRSKKDKDSKKSKKKKRDSSSSSDSEPGGPVRLSKYMGNPESSDDNSSPRRDAISGKKIKLKISKSKRDKMQELNRQQYLSWLNAQY
eukprot:c6015_g1_i1.p1 GENE.c6015_g1_i1~~c6015_g1_i1.p1  ORF type:complete len:159 (-),score=22.60 c6015_g1_i1:117-593(-)